MNSMKFKTKFLTVFLVFLLMFTGNSLVFFCTDAFASFNNESNRAVVGPTEMLKNNDFSKTSNWAFTNAVFGGWSHVIGGWSDSPPGQGQFFSAEPLDDHTGITISAFAYQTFTKSIWTPNYPEAVMCGLNWKMIVYDSSVDNGSERVAGEILIQIVNTTTPNNQGEWNIVTGSSAFETSLDPKIGKEFFTKIPVGANQSSYSICPPGNYRFSIEFRITVPVATYVDTFICDLRIDNVSLTINDVYEPLIVANKNTYGPYNADPLDIIDVDFYNGGLENTTLKEGKYRLNSSGKQWNWYTLFSNQYSYTQNWSITPFWWTMNEGNNTIEIYSEDTVGNFNDSVHITVIKDTAEPESKVNPLPTVIKKRSFDIDFEASDSCSGVDYVQLWYRFNNTWYQYRDINSNINFTNSPILFTTQVDGLYEFISIAFDKAGNTEQPGTPSGYIHTDTSTIVDTRAPKAFLKLPTEEKLRGEVMIEVETDPDVAYIEFYYWLDIDGDGVDDPKDIDSTWKLIKNVTSLFYPINWTVIWDTLDYIKYPEFRDHEHFVILKAMCYDWSNQYGVAVKNFIKVDNVPPIIEINNSHTLPWNEEYFLFIDYFIKGPISNLNFSWSYRYEYNWNLIETLQCNTSTENINGIYYWKLPDELRDEHLSIEFKIEALDDVGNIGISILRLDDIPPKYDCNLEEFPKTIMLNEDFGSVQYDYAKYECRMTNEPEIDIFRWYITGNSEKILHITDNNNNNGENDDTFKYTSIPDKYGTETIIFHMVDPLGLEVTIEQIITVTPVNDLPVLDLPTDAFHVTNGKPDTIDLSIYISDVDNSLVELIIITDDTEHITVSGLNLTFNYPASMNGMNKVTSIRVSDGEETSKGTLNVKITDNQRPILTKPFPIDVKLKEDETLWNFLYIDHHFKDPEGLPLIYSATSENVFIEINANSSVTFCAKPNVNGLEKVIFRATDPLDAWCEGVMIITIEDVPDPPRISHIPDMNIHWHNPRSDDGYSYDFSYFIYDPDNDDSELTIWISPISTNTDESWIEYDPINNMRLILKFPFSAAGKTHRLALYAIDPQGNQTYRIFNVTVIFDEWSVEQLRSIPDQYFMEDTEKDNAFDIWDYFQDIDGGTNFEILSDPDSMIKAEIDENNYVDLSTKLNDWNTGDGYVELVILAKDTQPIQEIYAVVRVYVIPMKDDPVLHPLPTINTVTKKITILDLSQYISDVDTELNNLRIITRSEENLYVEINGMLLFIKSNKSGTYKIDVWVLDVDDSKSNPQELIVVVDKATEKEDKFVYIDTITTWRIVMVTIIIIIMAILIFMAWKKKKLTISEGNKNADKISQLPITSIKRNQAQKMSGRILDSHLTIEPPVAQTPTSTGQATSPNITTGPSPQAPPTSLEPINQQIQTINQNPRLPPKPKT